MGKAKSTRKANRNLTVSYGEDLLAGLRNPAEARAYLNVSLQDGDPRIFLTALGHVVKANGGFAALAEKTGLNRENLYRTLSAKGNPKVGNVDAILESLGMRLSVELRKPARKRAA